LPGVVRNLTPIGSRNASVGPGGYDLAVSMLALGMVDQAHHAQ
jgi:hypothetical protein